VDSYHLLLLDIDTITTTSWFQARRLGTRAAHPAGRRVYFPLLSPPPTFRQLRLSFKPVEPG
jgi:hypothetical protein